jgi:hypothetical protein
MREVAQCRLLMVAAKRVPWEARREVYSWMMAGREESGEERSHRWQVPSPGTGWEFKIVSLVRLYATEEWGGFVVI